MQLGIILSEKSVLTQTGKGFEVYCSERFYEHETAAWRSRCHESVAAKSAFIIDEQSSLAAEAVFLKKTLYQRPHQNCKLQISLRNCQGEPWHTAGCITFFYRGRVVYLNPTAACHTKASNRKKTGITGRTSTNGSKME